MVVAKKQDQQAEEKQWENPLNPEKPGDARDQEQLQRQYKEAKRRHDNLTENQNKEKR
jgi:hypothetical protein